MTLLRSLLSVVCHDTAGSLNPYEVDLSLYQSDLAFFFTTSRPFLPLRATFSFLAFVFIPHVFVQVPRRASHSLPECRVLRRLYLCRFLAASTVTFFAHAPREARRFRPYCLLRVPSKGYFGYSFSTFVSIGFYDVSVAHRTLFLDVFRRPLLFPTSPVR